MKYLNELKKLKLPLGSYAIFGSGPLAIRNLRENKDVDLIVSEKLWNDLKKNNKVNANGSLSIGPIELWNEWQGMNINELINDAEIIKGLPFVKLDHVITWKKKMNREKDVKDLKLISKHLSGMI